MWDCGGGEVQLRLLSSPAVQERARVSRHGTCDEARWSSVMAVESGETRGGERVQATPWWSQSSHEQALPVDRAARAWWASARRRTADRPTWNVETANRLLRFRQEDTRTQGAGGLVITEPTAPSRSACLSLRCAAAGLGGCSQSLLSLLLQLAGGCWFYSFATPALSLRYPCATPALPLRYGVIYPLPLHVP